MILTLPFSAFKDNEEMMSGWMDETGWLRHITYMSS